MKIFIVLLIIVAFFTHGKGLVLNTDPPTTTSTSTATVTTTVITTTPPPSPGGIVSVNVTWTFYSGVNVTSVVMIVKHLQSGQWAALGLGQNPAMGEAHVFMCKRISDDTVKLDRYKNPDDHDDPEAAGSEEGGVISLGQQIYADGVVTCQFNLSNFNTETFPQVNSLNPLSQSGSYYPLFAIGPLDSSDNEPYEHYDDSHTANADTVQLNKNENILYRINNPTTSSSSPTGSTTSNPQTTSTTITSTQSPSPTATVTVNVTWTFYSGVNVTNVVMIVKNLQGAQWAAIGLGQNSSMGEAHVFMCKRLPNNTIVLNRYKNPHGHDYPDYAGPEDGGVISLGQQLFADGVVTCQFNLSNFNTETFPQLDVLRPLSQSATYHPLFAIGSLDEDYEPNRHSADSRTANADTVQLNKYENILYRINNPTTSSSSPTGSTTTNLPTSSTTIITTTTVSPTADVSVNVTWTFYSALNTTNVVMIVKNLDAGEWAAIGLGQNPSMGEAHVFMCKRLRNDTVLLNRYKNPNEHDDPEAAGSEEGGVISLDKLVYANNVVTCQFNLSNFNTETFPRLNSLRPLSLSESYHPLFAIGLLNSRNEPNQHSSDSRTANADTVQLNKNENILYKVTNPDVVDLTKYYQAHGIIMVFAWIFFASTGILISRYFKTSWANSLVCGEAAWFAGHRFLLSTTTILTILGFLFILVACQGTWVARTDEIKHYIHSITGAIVISFAFFQPFIALFRCKPNSKFRFIYNYIHGFIGFSAFILSIVTLFLASYFKLFTSNEGRLAMIVWIIWLVLIFIIFEIMKNYFGKHNDQSRYTNINASNKTIEEIVEMPVSSSGTSNHSNNEQKPTMEEKLKNIFLAIHILIAAIISIFLATLIG